MRITCWLLILYFRLQDIQNILTGLRFQDIQNILTWDNSQVVEPLLLISPAQWGPNNVSTRFWERLIPIWKDEVCWALVDVVWKDAKGWLWTRTTSLNFQRLIFSYLQKYFLFPKQNFPNMFYVRVGCELEPLPCNFNSIFNILVSPKICFLICICQGVQ